MNFPFLGVGLSYRSEFSSELINNLSHIDFLEVMAERFFAPTEDKDLSYLLQKKPIILHGVDLSIGSWEEVDKQHVQKIESVIGKIKPLWFSEHIAYTHIEDVKTNQLMPVRFSKENIKNIAQKVKYLKQVFDIPLLLENIAYYFKIPGSVLSELDFLRELALTADCKLLLDLNNLYVNSVNFNYDPYEFLSQYPLERVREIHLAGCEYMEGFLVDTHGHPICEEVWRLLQFVKGIIEIPAIVIEREKNFPDFHMLLEEIKRTKSILKGDNIRRELKIGRTKIEL